MRYRFQNQDNARPSVTIAHARWTWQETFGRVRISEYRTTVARLPPPNVCRRVMHVFVPISDYCRAAGGDRKGEETIIFCVRDKNENHPKKKRVYFWNVLYPLPPTIRLRRSIIITDPVDVWWTLNWSSRTTVSDKIILHLKKHCVKEMLFYIEHCECSYFVEKSS